MSYKEEGYAPVSRELKHRNDMFLRDDGWKHDDQTGKWISPGGTEHSRTVAVKKMKDKRKRAARHE